MVQAQVGAPRVSGPAARLTRHVTAYLNPEDCLDWFNKLKPTPFLYKVGLGRKGHF